MVYYAGRVIPVHAAVAAGLTIKHTCALREVRPVHAAGVRTYFLCARVCLCVAPTVYRTLACVHAIAPVGRTDKVANTHSAAHRTCVHTWSGLSAFGPVGWHAFKINLRPTKLLNKFHQTAYACVNPIRVRDANRIKNVA